MNASPRISILMPVFNAERYIGATIETVIAQTYTDWELIVMDGASTDATAAIARRYAEQHPAIRVVSEPDQCQNHGLTKAAVLARGEFITILAASDGYLATDWYARSMTAMDRNPEVSLVWGIPFDMSEEGQLLAPHFIYAHLLHTAGDFSQASILRKILSKLDIRHPSSILAFFKKVNRSNVTALRHMLRQEDPPQKQAWFEYWLTTGVIFPDGNMIVGRKAYFDCMPQYVLGSRTPIDWMEFYYNFNARGYLAYCIPIPANFGRIHRGQLAEAIRLFTESTKQRYFERIARLRAEYARDPDRRHFIDRAGRPLTAVAAAAVYTKNNGG
jgi:glycosyltransferase involved in cell wall biosynthesis